METGITNPAKTYVDPHSDLIDGCRKGDHTSQFMIYKLYYKAMYNTALRIVNDTMEAEDIMQESFLTAFEKIDTLKGNMAFGSWLKKIVQNRALDSLDKSKKMICSNIDTLAASEIPVEEATPADDHCEQRYGRFRQALDRLPQNYREISSLYFLEGYDNVEISQIMSVSAGTVRSQLSRARKMIMSQIG